MNQAFIRVEGCEASRFSVKKFPRCQGKSWLCTSFCAASFLYAAQIPLIKSRKNPDIPLSL
jgi:hypothetical protein